MNGNYWEWEVASLTPFVFDLLEQRHTKSEGTSTVTNLINVIWTHTNLTYKRRLQWRDPRHNWVSHGCCCHKFYHDMYFRAMRKGSLLTQECSMEKSERAREASAIGFYLEKGQRACRHMTYRHMTCNSSTRPVSSCVNNEPSVINTSSGCKALAIASDVSIFDSICSSLFIWFSWVLGRIVCDFITNFRRIIWGSIDSTSKASSTCKEI